MNTLPTLAADEKDTTRGQAPSKALPVAPGVNANTERLPTGLPLSGGVGDLLSLGGALSGADLHSRTRASAVDAAADQEAHPSHCLLKRAFDAVFAVTAMLLVAPLLALCAIAIRLTSKGPILFFQARAGLGGNPFFIAKFRTMVVDAEAVLADYLNAHPEAESEWKKDQKLRRDPRITRIGAFMRKFSLDELPQLWNVLRGEMSIVGPRPIPLYEIPVYGDGYRDYCRVRPGLTGLWQVSGRSNIAYAHRVEIDRHYIQNWCAKHDVSIVMRTLPAVLKSAGAY